MATITTTVIPYSTTNFIRPGAGAEQWHNSTERIPDPVESQPVGTENSLDVYYRIQWSELEGSTQGAYTWTRLDSIFRDAITKGQRVSFGIMTVHAGNGTVTYDGAPSSYPLYLHNLMKAEATNSRDWIGGGGWIPNYNSTNYIGRLRALHEAIKSHLLTTTFTPTSGPNAGRVITFADVVYCIDIRGYGNYGEWHSGGYCDWSTYPAGRQPIATALKSIIDTHTQVFDRWPLVIMVAAFDGGGTFIPLFVPIPEVAHYAATATNAWGKVGWRKDQYGATDAYLATLLENNNVTYNGSPQLKTILMNTWKTAPITGEPPAWTPDGPDLMRQVTTYHTTSFGNGNYGGYPPLALRDQIRAAFKKAGYRLQIENGSFTNTATSIAVTLNWKNSGISPTYEDWNVALYLKASNGNIAAQTLSAFKPKMFLPSTTATAITDNWNFSVPAGTYTLVVKVIDAKNYRQAMPLYITGAQADNSYNLGTVVVGSAPPVNQPPTANAGPDKEITLPTSSVTMTGTATDSDGTVTVLWAKVSGSGTITSPTSLTTTVTGLTEGASIFSLTATDNSGAKAVDTVNIVVKPAVVVPKTVVSVTIQTATYKVTYSDGSTEIF